MGYTTKRVGYHTQKAGYHTQRAGYYTQKGRLSCPKGGLSYPKGWITRLPYHSHRTNPHHRRQETTAPAVFLVRAILTRAVKTRCHVDHVGQAPLNPIKWRISGKIEARTLERADIWGLQWPNVKAGPSRRDHCPWCTGIVRVRHAGGWRSRVLWTLDHLLLTLLFRQPAIETSLPGMFNPEGQDR